MSKGPATENGVAESIDVASSDERNPGAIGESAGDAEVASNFAVVANGEETGNDDEELVR